MECRGRSFDDARLAARVAELNPARQSVVSLVNTSVSHAGIKIIARFPQLRSLLVYRGPMITDRAVSYLRKATELRELYLNGTAISDKALAYVGHLPHIWSVCLDDTAVADAGCRHLEGLRSLFLLSLKGTRVQGHGLVDLPNNRHFSLYLEGSAASDEGVIAFSRRLTKLKTLSLNATAVTDAVARSLAKLRYLESLLLSGTAITDEGLAAFHGHPRLFHLYLERCKVSAAAVKRLKRATPALNHVYGP